MAYIIAEPCVGTCDTACVEVCPVDCIHPTKDEWDEKGWDENNLDDKLLYIDPEECIDCGACEPECPVAVSYTHLRAHETRGNLVCRLLLEKKK